jgi:hypothetical protein
VSGQASLTPLQFIASIFQLAIVTFIASSIISTYTIEPFMRDGSINNRPRFTINQAALDTISQDANLSVVALGSSMMFKDLDGGCVSQQMESNAVVYNLGQVMSRPYTDMLNIPRLVNSAPELVLIEIGPNLLFNTPENPLQQEYIKLRFNLDSMYQSSEDLGDWIDIIEPEHKSWIAMNEYERIMLRQEYVPKAIEERLLNIFNNETFRPEWISPGSYGWVPSPNSPTWEGYLQTPIFPDDSFGFDGMTVEERNDYNISGMKGAASYYPIKGSQSHSALDYEIYTLLENGIKVLIVTPPQHPESLNYVEPGQWDILNETIDTYLQMENVSLFYQLWEDGWEEKHFYDRNHLDDEGRLEFCQRLAPVIDQVLNL